MDGNESKNLWDQLSNFFKSYFERLTNWSARHGIQFGKNTTKQIAKKGKDLINQNKSEYALQCVKEAGNTKELRSSGVYNGHEMREIAQMAKDRGIPILIRKEDEGYGRRELSNSQAKKLTRHQKELSKLKEKQSKFAGDKTKIKKLRSIMKEIDNLENQIKNDSKTKAENFSFIVNASANGFAKEMEEKYGKTEIAKAQNEIDGRLGIENDERTFISLNKKNSEITAKDLVGAGNYGNIPIDSFENKKHLVQTISLDSYANLLKDPEFAENFDHCASKKENSNHMTIRVDAELEEQWVAFYDNNKVKKEESEIKIINDNKKVGSNVNHFELEYSGEGLSNLKNILDKNEIGYRYSINFKENESTPLIMMEADLDKEKIQKLIPEQKKTNELNLNKEWKKENEHLNHVQKGLVKEKENDASKSKTKSKASKSSKER